VQLDSGRQLRAHAVIVATGFRALHGESKYFKRGLHLTYKGYARSHCCFSRLSNSLHHSRQR
jgi:hypothetical protein